MQTLKQVDEYLDLLCTLLEGKNEKSCPKLATHELNNNKDLRQIKYLPQSLFTVQFFSVQDAEIFARSSIRHSPSTGAGY
jgi:hypothetical protein